MNEYDQQAEDFLKSTGAKLTIKYKDTGLYFSDDKSVRDIYTFILRKDGKSYSATFGQSIADSGKAPSAYDILACLRSDEPETIDELISEYGYEINSAADYRKLDKIAKQLKRQNAGLRRLFSDDELDRLNEIQ